MLVPPERIAEMAKFAKGEEGYDTPVDLVIKTAWHETGHAIGWVLNGGALERATIIPNGDDGGVLWGETVYGIDDQKVVWTKEERQLQAFAAMCGAAICKFAGFEDVFETMDDIERAIEWLQPLYPAPEELCGQLIKTWIEVLNFFGTPRVWRTAEAFARKLVLQGTIEGFPRECISDDNSPIPGLQDSLAKALGTGDPWEQHDWLCRYVMLDYDQIRRHHRAIASEPGQDPRQLDLFRQPAPATQADPPEGRPLFRPIPLFDRAAGFRAFTAASTAACLIRLGAPLGSGVGASSISLP
jgi:hypothetical protein